MGRPATGWRTFTRSDFILVPLPAARISVAKVCLSVLIVIPFLCFFDGLPISFSTRHKPVTGRCDSACPSSFCAAEGFGGQDDLYLLDRLHVGILDHELDVARAELLHPARNPSHLMEKISRQGLIRPFRNADRNDLPQPLDADVGADQVLARAQLADGALPLVVFVADIAHDLLEDVLDRHDAHGPAVLVDDHRHRLAALLHLQQEIVGGLAGGHVE